MASLRLAAILEMPRLACFVVEQSDRFRTGRDLFERTGFEPRSCYIVLVLLWLCFSDILYPCARYIACFEQTTVKSADKAIGVLWKGVCRLENGVLVGVVVTVRRVQVLKVTAPGSNVLFRCLYERPVSMTSTNIICRVHLLKLDFLGV